MIVDLFLGVNCCFSAPQGDGTDIGVRIHHSVTLKAAVLACGQLLSELSNLIFYVLERSFLISQICIMLGESLLVRFENSL